MAQREDMQGISRREFGFVMIFCPRGSGFMFPQALQGTHSSRGYTNDGSNRIEYRRSFSPQ